MPQPIITHIGQKYPRPLKYQMTTSTALTIT
jgi:hypothetical protein